MYVCTCGREVWWLLACLPQLSGALPDRTLNPARLNLGIIRGYKPRSTPLPLAISRTPARPGPSPHPAIFRSPFSTGHEEKERAPHPSRARKHSTRAVVPTCDPRTPLLEFGLDTELLLRTHPREHFRRWTTRETRRRTDVSGPFLHASRNTRRYDRKAGKSRVRFWSPERKKEREIDREFLVMCSINKRKTPAYQIDIYFRYSNLFFV